MKLYHLLITVSMALSISSCGHQSVPQKLDDFVDNVELNKSKYTSSDWERSSAKYEQLVNEYVTSNKQYSDAEREMAARAMGRYYALLLKNGIEKSTEFIKNIGAILPEYIEGFALGLEENAGGIESALENLFDEEKIENSLDVLNEKLEKIFNNTDR